MEANEPMLGQCPPVKLRRQRPAKSGMAMNDKGHDEPRVYRAVTLNPELERGGPSWGASRSAARRLIYL